VLAKHGHVEALHAACEEEQFEVPVADGVLVGHRGGDGPPALVLHGGPAMCDYTEGLAGELSGLFADPATAMPVPPRVGAQCSRDTVASIVDHFERHTLLEGLPSVRLPMLFVHGVLDPVPLRSVDRTASLVPGARLEPISGCGHFPWWERPGEIRRIVGEWLEAG